MKKALLNHLLFVFLILTSFQLFSQTVVRERAEIEWDKSRASPAGVFPSFENAIYGHEVEGVPIYSGKLSIAPDTEYEAFFSSISFENASGIEEKALKNHSLPVRPEIKLGYGSLKDDHRLIYSFFPYIRENGRLRRVSSFEIEFRSQPASRITRKTSAFKSNSILASGEWHKYRVEEDGVYKLTPELLANSGFQSENISLTNVRVFGNGAGILPEANSGFRKDDLNEIPLKAVDANQNGVFDGNDYILFYAKGPHTWNYNSSTREFSHVTNFYRDYNYYFVTVDQGPGARISTIPENAGAPNQTVSSFDDYLLHEEDLENLVGAGRVWLGEVFDFELEKAYGFNFPGVITSEPARLRVRAVARASTANTFMNVAVNGISLLNMNFPAYGTGVGANYVNVSDETASFIPGNPGISVRLRYDNNANPTGVAWLDFIELQVRRNLSYQSKALFFRDVRSIGAGNVSEFRITGAGTNVEVWDVTDINTVFSLAAQHNGNVLTFKAATDSLRQFVALSGTDFPQPEYVGKVENQNLHAMSPAAMVIVAHKNFLQAAERLAEFHRTTRQLSVEVVEVESIYNEFSSGGQDISAIRNFMRMLYERNSGATSDLRYLLLFGDASYDYRDRLTGNSNFVPIWQANNSPFSLYNSSVSDDFFGQLSPNEGVNLQNGLLDLGVGRIPCATAIQAQQVVDKIMHYASSANRFGDWRNRILLMADDVDASWETRFVTTSEELERKARESSNAFNVDKIYLDSYKQTTVSGTEAYPEATKDMYRKVQQGNLVTNYIGHGGEIGLASEKLLTLTQVNSWSNYDAMPLFITITCEFTRVDDPKRVSAGEQMLLNPKGGAIALISTTRVVNVGTGIDLNEQVFDSLLTRPGGEPKKLGDIVMDAKNGSPGDYDRLKFSLFGDPSMQLAIPYYKVQTNSINGKNVSVEPLDTLQALSKVTINGQVNDLSNQKMESFNGVLNISVFDKASQRQTLRNDNEGPVLDFTVQNNLIYRGKVGVSNGDFDVEFLVPEDIAYQYGFGKISYYATNGLGDAAGSFDTLVVGGINRNAPEDKIGPRVELYINDQSFVRGGITNKDPELFALISDSSGINTVGNGIGHDLVAILDNQTDQSYVINEYYEADLNSYKSGRVVYPFYDLEPGEHTLKLKVFDVYNNFSEAETEFIVVEDEEVALRHVLNYPNPFTTYTEFQFEHNRANQPLDVQVQIFTVSGKLVKTINTSVVPGGNRVTGIAWNGLDDYGDKIGKGVYVYRLKVRTQSDNSQAEKYEKLVILR